MKRTPVNTNGDVNPITETDNHDNLVQKGDYCLASPGKIYVVFLRNGSGNINLENQSGDYDISWFDPRNGGSLKTNTVKSIKAGKILELKDAPSEANKDWVVLLRKKN